MEDNTGLSSKKTMPIGKVSEMERKIVWIGKYQEYINSVNIIGSISKFGIERSNHFVFDPHKYLDYESYVLERVRYFVNYDSEINFYFYDQYLAHKIDSHISIADHTICVNPINILFYLNNKSIAREWIRNIVKTPETIILSNNEIEVDRLKSMFWGYERFVAQCMISSGGHKTFLIDKYHIDNLALDSDLYIVSPYYTPSLSVNITSIIFQNGISTFPLSVQIIEEDNGKLLYKGSDFLAAKLIPQKIINKLQAAANNILNRLNFLGYRGICGIDFLIYNDEIYFLEINPRFQGSSFLIEKSLKKHHLSLYQLNIEAFYKKMDAVILEYLSQIFVPYSFKTDKNERIIGNTQIIGCYPENQSTGYYDYFADKYHIMLQNWEEKIDKQGKIIKEIFKRYSKIDVQNVLDCTCGIGIQAISLAQEGFCVTGSDLSRNELNFAREEAKKRGLSVTFIQTDCRYLENSISQKFDAVISIDSALPHLLTRENFLLAFQSIYERLNLGGVFISSYRDYEALLKSKPLMAYPVRFNSEAGVDYTILRKWKWEGEYIFSKQYVIADSPSESKLYTNTYMQWAITKSELIELASKTKYSECYWLLPEESGFTQPVLCLVK